jgi:hypothetical protein
MSALSPVDTNEGAVPIGRRFDQSGYDARRSTLSVVAWIVILLAGYWVATDWQSLPQLVTTVMTRLH